MLLCLCAISTDVRHPCLPDAEDVCRDFIAAIAKSIETLKPASVLIIGCGDSEGIRQTCESTSVHIVRSNANPP